MDDISSQPNASNQNHMDQLKSNVHEILQHHQLLNRGIYDPSSHTSKNIYSREVLTQIFARVFGFNEDYDPSIES
eukprot:CAMPEP_0182434792 /NCGR_PEP_ID=MMETSP1167-20130531/71850_1 /TAXON_ID=2988 /ORGANISM="Mallomonas Sp, Strain CCMP3275" /LENGTH=74 /DNA_ID=CAMNT_0024625047 /DNA_START=23 /DNA_END=243 /DNA_ORIENTATION=-